ncbi:hypothetical protein FRC11_011145 [Ceratobasidium sp. 423]|nr:hypothetical protein FRC11_011145 [Ceratobasidium sp. 423]
MPPKQKRQLEDPSDISITRAPQAPKKTRNKRTTGGPNNLETSASNTILPASIANPTPEDVSLATTETSGATDKKSKTATKRKQQPKKNVKMAATATTDEMPESVPQTSNKRKITPSFVAQQVALQEAAENNKKATKTKKQAKKAATKIIQETPDETRAFLERLKASSVGTPPDSTVSGTGSVIAATAISTAMGNSTRLSTAPIDKRKALNKLAQAHPTASTASVVSIASSFSSIAPSESVSQAKPTPPDVLPRPKTKKGAKAPTPSLLDVPTGSSTSSRDTSPLPEQLMDDDLAKYSSDLDIDPTTILDGIPKDLAPVLTMPEPLPAPLYVPERRVPLPTIDLNAFPAAERAKIKAKHQLKVKDLKPLDQTVVSSALSRMGALLTTVCGFPDKNTAWLLACNANSWASKKYNRNLKLTKGSEYQKLLYDRIPQMRTGFVSEKNRTAVALNYKFQCRRHENRPSDIHGPPRTSME